MELQANDNQAAIVAALESKGIHCKTLWNGRVKTLCINPDHNDSRPSYEIYPSGSGICRSKCGFQKPQEVADLLGVDLPAGDYGLTVTRLALEKGLDEDQLREWGVEDGFQGKRRLHCVDIPYHDENGEAVYTRQRLSLYGRERFKSPKGAKPMLYGLSYLDDVRKSGKGILVEGESDTWSCWTGRIPALGVPGATTWMTEWNSLLDGITPYVFKEPDEGGASLVKTLGSELPELMVMEAPPDAKDCSELYQLDPDNFFNRMKELIERAIPYSAYKAEADSAEAKAAAEIAGALIESSDVLGTVKEAMRAGGYAGDLRPPMTAYFVLTSRLLSEPSNAAFIAQSSSGKNAAVDAARALMPATSYYLLNAGSPQALIHSEEEYEHRVVVVQEADSIPEEGPAASAIRSLMTDNVMEYEIVEKDAATNKLVTRKISKAGPTGLLTTSTRTLGDQATTRLLQVAISDSPTLTRDVMLSQARRRNESLPEFDTAPLIALQRYLELAGETRVFIPYAEELARTVPAGVVRMRRDFPQLLTFIQVSAVLHQHNRERSDDGKLIANAQDYDNAKWVLAETFITSVTEGATQAVRETVAAVESLIANGRESVNHGDLSKELNRSASSISDRVRKAIKAGWIVNLQTLKGQKSKLVMGTPIANTSALPELDPNTRTHEHTADTSQVPATRSVSMFDSGSRSPEHNGTANTHPNAAASQTPSAGTVFGAFGSKEGDVPLSDEEDKERSIEDWLIGG